MTTKYVSPALIIVLFVLAIALSITYDANGDLPNNNGTTTTTATVNTAHTPGLTGSITQKGSDTILPLAQLFAENFMDNNSGVLIQVSGGGSAVGFTSLIDGTTDIADASRQMKPSEIEYARSNGINDVEWKIAVDGITIVVHPDNPVNRLTIEQLRDIYVGEIDNWNQVGGPDLPIILFGRQSTSGTYEFLKKHVLDNQNFAPNTLEQTGTAQIAEQVARSPGGIGYGGVGYFVTRTDVHQLEIGGVAPTIENIIAGDYPLWRYLYLYTDGVPSMTADPALYYYLTFILSPDGQALNGLVEYLSLTTTTLNEMRTMLGLEMIE